MKKIGIIFLFIILGIVLVLGIIRLFSGENNWLCQKGEWVKHGQPSAPKPTKPCPGQIIPTVTSEKTYKVIKVIDGDTIEIENGQKVRYIGVDTAEMDDKDPVKLCYAQKAFEKNKELVEGKEIRLGKDVSEKDKYGRLLRYVYVGETFVNDYLTRSGFASAVTYPPDIKYQKQFQEAQREAKDNNLGLWNSSTCPNQ